MSDGQKSTAIQVAQDRLFSPIISLEYYRRWLPVFQHFFVQPHVHLRVSAASEEADPAEQVKVLSQAARAIAEASHASIGQKKRWADEVREKLDALELVAQKAGKWLDAEMLKAVREKLYGG